MALKGLYEGVFARDANLFAIMGSTHSYTSACGWITGNRFSLFLYYNSFVNLSVEEKAYKKKKNLTITARSFPHENYNLMLMDDQSLWHGAARTILTHLRHLFLVGLELVVCQDTLQFLVVGLHLSPALGKALLHFLA